MKNHLSVIVIVYNMRREAKHTLNSLSKKYQCGVKNLNYEVIVVDNGSDTPLGNRFVCQFGKNFSYYYLDNPPPSPAYAINYGVKKANSEFIAIMIDGAHILTPGVLKHFWMASNLFPNPIIATRNWFLGPGQQSVTMLEGYNQEKEDELLEKISWPKHGYRLFNIGVFIGKHNPGWLSRFLESNCLFIRKCLFVEIGGANAKFDIAGGGFLNLDILRECTKTEGTSLVSILGEATFHQIHGGTTTNVPAKVRERKVARYRQQYLAIRGEEYRPPSIPIHYFGRLPLQKKASF